MLAWKLCRVDTKNTIAIVFVIETKNVEDTEEDTFPVTDEICNAVTVTVIFFLLPLRKKKTTVTVSEKNNRNGAASVTSQLSEGTVIYR